ncbi:myb, DNA-binding protein [Grosmannia clavigera kw1407]|uniref:Myb, DNA-binding protein n=1 Tax=Grosmannia clavigera (strain kw1407 / UAMH 11150) TaxID=655863 RepID=F0X899_GROCL|nr:myb, DNA-binding protein [Grosmannia clavigera kw1407]EFX05377.1 myb, DNA-binding protein [Grosmannia clavigera kw1407]
MSSSLRPINAGAWLPAEDNRLRDAVVQYGTRWVVVAAKVATRNSDQCAKRWKENLNPDLDHSPWTPHTDGFLLHLVDLFGHNWKYIANNFLEARAPLSVKNRYALLMRRLKRKRGHGKQPSSSSTSPHVPLPPALFGGSFGLPTASASLTATSIFPVDDGNLDAISPFEYSQSGAEGDRTRPASKDSSTLDLTVPFITPPPTTSDNSSTTIPTAIDTTDYSNMENQYLSLADFRRSTPSSALNNSLDGIDLQFKERGTWQPILTGMDEFLSGNDSRNRNSNNNDTALDDVVSKYGFTNPAHRPHDESRSDQAQEKCSEIGNNSNEIEYSVTCPRGKIKRAVYHLLDATIMETADRLADEEKITLTLRLKTT